SLQTIAHEWTHNYLFFRPLGFNYNKNRDVTAINETVADLVGHELAAAVVARWPLAEEQPAQPAADLSPESPPPPRPNLAPILRKLRGDVDELLKTGQIESAETLMEQTREQLAAQGVRIRKLNQAYFAFLNLYAGEAGSPAATNPIGPKVDQLRQRSASLREFVTIVGGVTSVAGLDRALAARVPADTP